MNHNNHTAKVEIALAFKKIQVLGLITFGDYSSLQKIQNFIRVLRPIIFKSCSFPQEIQIFVGI